MKLTQICAIHGLANVFVNQDGHQIIAIDLVHF
jgi:hypothetical protein